MAYSDKEKTDIVNDICRQVSEGKSTRNSITESGIKFSTFYVWIDADVLKSKQYTRATELRAELMADELMTISDSTADDIITDERGNEIINHNVIQRDKLRIDTRKWLMSKMMPKKYGENKSLDLTTLGEKITQPPITWAAPEKN